MFSTLYRKLVAVLLGFGAVMIVMTVMVIRLSQEAYHMEMNQRLYRDVARKLVAEHIVSEDRAIDQRQLAQFRSGMTPALASLEVFLLDREGRILSSSVGPEKVRLSQVGLAPLQRFLAAGDDFPILGQDPTDPAKERVFSCAPVALPGGGQGYLYVTLRSSPGDDITKLLMKTYSVREGMWLITGGIALALLAGLVMIKWLTRPLQQLTAAMDQFRRGDFGEQPRLSLKLADLSKDEVGRLWATFHKMARRIHAQMSELKQNDAARRELLANISHDLRTPLASLQGYLETVLLKEQSLCAEDRRHYLEIAAKQCARLNTLINRLFQLVKLDAVKVEISAEPFALAELVQDVAQKLALAAAKARVSLDVEQHGNLPLVFADIGLIEQVLENLIDNALRHTPAGGRITVKLNAGERDVEVRVSDTGSGIAPEALPKIFDRFYRGEESRGEAPDRAGLGLAIVKRILELHCSSITVSSVPGAGTTFSFRLPKFDPEAHKGPRCAASRQDDTAAASELGQASSSGTVS